MTKKQLRKAKREVRKQQIKKLRFMGKVSYYLGAMSFRIRNTGYGTLMDWNTSMGVGIKYHFEVTDRIYGFHPLMIISYFCFCVVRGLAKMWEALMDIKLIDKHYPKKVTYIDYYNKNK